MPSGSLTVVGTGYLVAGQVTAEALSAIVGAEKLFHLVSDPATRRWLESVNSTAESLVDAYAVGKPRHRSYAEMVERMLAPVRRGRDVCAAFYGHPGIFATPGHVAVARARAEGHEAQMLPGVSAEDCLWADLGVDPGEHGCQSFEASAFVARRRPIDPTSILVLWQIGAVGVTDFRLDALWSREGLVLLVERLEESYPPDHEVVVYEAAQLPVCEPRIDRLPLRDLAAARVTVISTLYVPPVAAAPLDPEMLARLGMAGPG